MLGLRPVLGGLGVPLALPSCRTPASSSPSGFSAAAPLLWLGYLPSPCGRSYHIPMGWPWMVGACPLSVGLPGPPAPHMPPACQLSHARLPSLPGRPTSCCRPELQERCKLVAAPSFPQHRIYPPSLPGFAPHACTLTPIKAHIKHQLLGHVFWIIVEGHPDGLSCGLPCLGLWGGGCSRGRLLGSDSMCACGVLPGHETCPVWG